MVGEIIQPWKYRENGGCGAGEPPDGYVIPENTLSAADGTPMGELADGTFVWNGCEWVDVNLEEGLSLIAIIRAANSR